MGVVSDLVKGLTGPVADYLKTRTERKSIERVRKMELDNALHEKKLTAIRESDRETFEWEIKQIENSGWKDEYVLIVLSIPLVGCFIPVINGYILAGFVTLQQTPDWYRWLIMAIFAAIYGIRLWKLRA